MNFLWFAHKSHEIKNVDILDKSDEEKLQRRNKLYNIIENDYQGKKLGLCSMDISLLVMKFEQEFEKALSC